MEIAAILFSLFFALNIGASGAAASMGIAYGSGAIRKPIYALSVCAVGILAGSVIGGGEVVKTISSGIMPESVITLEIVCIIIGSAALSLFIANLMAIPLSTSEVTVGAVVGVAVAYKVLYVKSILVIVSFWVIIPIVAFLFTFIVVKIIRMFPKRTFSKKGTLILSIILIISGFLEAFSAGMNNVANAVGPLLLQAFYPLGKERFTADFSLHWVLFY